MWSEFMRSVRVLTVCVAEPRLEVPLEVIRALFESLAASDDFVCIQLHLVLLVLLFTFSRVECPCPKTFSGVQSYDLRYHWSVDDFRLVESPTTAPILWVRFKGFKQDARMERPAASHADPRLPFVPGDHGDSKDWVPIGDVPGDPLFSIALAYKRFVRALARARRPSDPMFVAKDRVRAYTYGCISADFHAALLSVGVTQKYGLHGFRVAGYNLCKAALGVELTVVHGGWSAEGAGHTRYARYALAAVFGIPAAMVGAVSAFPDAAVRVPSRARGTRHGTPHEPAIPLEENSDAESDHAVVEERVASDGEPDVAPLEEASLSTPRPPLPPGYTTVVRVSGRGSGVSWPEYIAPDGSILRSKVSAWRHFQLDAECVPSEDSPPLVLPSRVEKVVSFDEHQCGDPLCNVPSRNGRHGGLHVFPEPTRRFGRRRAHTALA